MQIGLGQCVGWSIFGRNGRKRAAVRAAYFSPCCFSLFLFYFIWYNRLSFTYFVFPMFFPLLSFLASLLRLIWLD